MEIEEYQDPGMGRLQALIERLFPERQLHFRTEGRVSFIRLSRRAQIGVVVLFALAGSWLTMASVSYVLHDKLLDAKDNQIANARLAYRSLLDEVASYQRKFALLTSDLENNHSMMLKLVEENTSLQQNLKSVENTLSTTVKERAAIVAARESLNEDLREIEKRMGTLANRNFALKDNLDSLETDMQAALAERNQALFEGGRMKRKIKELETRLVDLQGSQHESVQRLTDQTLANIDWIERVIDRTGIKVAYFLGPKGDATGQGGPFIAAVPDGEAGDRLKANLSNLDSHLSHWANLQKIMRALPLSAPLNAYSISSRYGKRRDPINKRWAAHYGLDMTAPMKSSVYATAPGVVTYVGWKGRYGRLIEVNHGSGVKTRYGHLSKILVKKGTRVSFRQKIALLGNTGRSTGAHLHYEVIVGKKPRNPSKFIKAGQHVLQD